jgi:hypothetical protein
MWEFTITIENVDYYNAYPYGSSYNNSSRNDATVTGLRAAVKKISRDHVGRDGRKGAVFERGSMGEGIVPDDPILKNLTSEEGQKDAGGGRWRIPLGAYQQLMTYLAGQGNSLVVEGIPVEQLRAATLGRERHSKKEHASVKDLVKRGVSRCVCEALAPYQRDGVEFILDFHCTNISSPLFLQ